MSLAHAIGSETEGIGLPNCSADVPDLKQALMPLSEVIDPHTKTPILKTALVTVRDGRMSFAVTNLSEHIVTSANADVTMCGQAAIDCVGLVKWVETLDRKQTVKFRSDGGELRAQCSRSRRQFKTAPVEHFPAPLTVADPAVSFALNDHERRRLLAVPAAIISKNSWRHEFTGASLRSVSGRLVAEAANPTQYVRTSVAVADDIGLPGGGVTIAKHSADFIVGMKGEIRFNSYLIEAIDTNCTYASKLLDARVESREHLVPDSCENYVEVDSLELANALNRLGTVVSLNKSPLAQLWWDLGGDQLHLTTSQASGEASDSIPVRSSGGGMTNAPIWPFLKLLEAIGNAHIRIDVSSPTAALKITIIDNDSFVALQMPTVSP